jgi:hypothetical protein
MSGGAAGQPALQVEAPKIRRRLLQLQAQLPSCVAFVATPYQYGLARNLVGEIDDAQLLSQGKYLRHYGKAAFRTYIDRVALRAHAPALFGPFDGHRYARIESPAAADVPHRVFKPWILQQRHDLLLRTCVRRHLPLRKLDSYKRKGVTPGASIGQDRQCAPEVTPA